MTAGGGSPLVTAPLGQTGHDITRLGLGAAHLNAGLGGDLSEDAAIATVRQALDLGITYIDTAPLYSDSERRIGLALRGHPRSDAVFIATKVGLQPDGVADYSFDGTMRSIETSLERLSQPMLHLAQIHEIEEGYWEQVWSPAGAVAALQRAKDQHLIGHIGVTGSDPKAVARAIETDVFETVLIWDSFHLLNQSIAKATLHLAAERKMGLVVGTPFAGSVLATGTKAGPRPNAGPQFMYEDARDEVISRVRGIEAVCDRHQVSLRAAALQFILRDDRVSTIIPGAVRPSQVVELLEAVTTEIPVACWDELTPLIGVRAPEVP
ncbi:MAG: hypothetical protein CL878_15105 [Dehalococcoidia bacterium]|nr:hypothetical protein [Dehalococcoidia bacterium]